ncbi:hypothetical protein RF11_00520 [Thelohanellus kitauei]|uniref:Uncharacterized protein n=1 Tax=Thelohanellus kitauei TaxID=669202 RepID=A0A0C2JRU6_THEKT|nr:hypothetical protein RF11_00520 [Thelohanellus kitauei]
MAQLFCESVHMLQKKVNEPYKDHETAESRLEDLKKTTIKLIQRIFVFYMNVNRGAPIQPESLNVGSEPEHTHGEPKDELDFLESELISCYRKADQINQRLRVYIDDLLKLLDTCRFHEHL